MSARGGAALRLLRPGLRPGGYSAERAERAAALAELIAGLDALDMAESAEARAVFEEARKAALDEDVEPSGPAYAEPAPVGPAALGWADVLADPPDPALSEEADGALAAAWLAARLMPWRRIAGETVWASDDPVRASREEEGRPGMPASGSAYVAVESAAFEAAFGVLLGERLAPAAAETLGAEESVRGLDWQRRAVGISVLLLLVFGTVWGKAVTAIGLMLVFAVNTLTGLLRGAALIAGLGIAPAVLAMKRRAALPGSGLLGRRASERCAASRRRARVPSEAPLPVLSVMVPLYREATMVPRILAALKRVDYPRELLDVKLVLEASDRRTRATAAATVLPPWVGIIVVPDGSPRTKPRALNYALGFCRGSVIGILDAEDRPEPGQFRAVARALAEAPEEVGCVQCQLSYYNARENWVTRCFQLEYAIWFEVLLRGFQRLGLPIPLGGTSVYFRREALVTAGGWDAHNVTEDADLGMRLARRGLRTLVLDSVTEEEANCRCLTWVRQRSRWLKGYLLTWLSHVRDPVRLWREMGPRGFLGFNVLFLGAAVSYGAMPLFWLSLIGWVATGQSLWGQWLPGWILWPLALSLGGGQAIMLGCAALAMWRRRALDLMLWVPVLPFYWTLGAMAAWKAVAELFIAPYYWDKTRHGISRVFLRRRGPFAGEPVAVRAEGARPAPAGPTAPAPSVARPMAR